MRPELSMSRERLDPDFFLDFFSVLYTNIFFFFFFFLSKLPAKRFIIPWISMYCIHFCTVIFYILPFCAHILPWKKSPRGGGVDHGFYIIQLVCSMGLTPPNFSSEFTMCVSNDGQAERGEIYWPVVFSKIDLQCTEENEETERKGRPEEYLSSSKP